MASGSGSTLYDFKGLGYSKIGHFKQVRSKIRELEDLSTELVRRHNELEAIIDNMTDGLTILDADLNIVFVNEVQKTMFPGENLVGWKCHEKFYHKKHACRECPALETMETLKTLRGEIIIPRGDLLGHSVEWTTSPIRDPSGRVSKIILLMRDITERKEYEHNLMRADRMAAVGLLAAGIAHEINNPLTSIAGFSEGLLKRLRSVPDLGGRQIAAFFRDYLQIINEEAYRCKDIIQNLIHFAQQSGEEHELVDMDAVVQDTVSLIRQRARRDGVSITVGTEGDLPAHWVDGNVSQLKHLFLNLFSYVLEAMETGEELAVMIRSRGHSVEVVVSDPKHGVSVGGRKESARSSSTASPGTGGAPLSLSICYSIMQHHNGSLEVSSIDGNGAAFVLRFPLAGA